MSSRNIDYHGALGELLNACRSCGIRYEADLLNARQFQSLSPSHWVNVLFRKGSIFVQHLRFAFRVFIRERSRVILVREFSNAPLAIIFPFIKLVNPRIWFVVNHNFQWAVQRKSEFAVFRFIAKSGCRFLFFERVPVLEMEALGITVENCHSVPHPVSVTQIINESFPDRLTVGVIGQFREEKGLDEVLACLVELPEEYRIILGFPNPGEFETLSSYSKNDRFELRNTADSNDYSQAISECDLLVLNHPVASYSFRASGLIADAASRHVAVVARESAVLLHQITYPLEIGECFSDVGDLQKCIDRACEKRRNGQYDFDAYNKARTGDQLALRLQDICLQNAEN